MAGIAHHPITAAAFDALPAWQRRIWRQERQALVSEYCVIPDAYYNRKFTRRYEPYCRLPNGRRVPHALANAAFNSFPSFTRDGPDLDNNLYVIRYYLQKVIHRLREGDHGSAAKFGGVLAHYLEDAIWPCHAMENTFFYELLPRPAGKYWQLHRVIDHADVTGVRVARTSPVLLGTGLDEAGFNLYHRLVKTAGWSARVVMPCLLAIYRGNRRKFARLMIPVAREAAGVVSAAWHTAFSLAFDRLSAAEVRALERVALADLQPLNRFRLLEKLAEPLDAMSHDPYLFAPLANEAVDDSRRNPDQSFPTLPLALAIQDGHRRREQVYRRGYAAAGTSRLTFFVDGRVYGRFEGDLGIHCRIPTKGRARFRVGISRDLRRFTAVYESGFVDRRATAQRASVRLPRHARYLRLETIKASPTAAPIVWGNPEIVKR